MTLEASVLELLRELSTDGVAPSSGLDRVLYRDAVRCFGSWDAAVEQAGLRRRQHERHSRDGILAELAAASAYGFAPSTGTARGLYDRAVRVFGSWSEACAAAGVRPRYRKGAARAA